MASKHNWALIKLEYASGSMSLTQIARAHDISIGTVNARSQKERWVQARVDFRKEAYQAGLKTLEEDRKAALAALRAEQLEVIGNLTARMRQLAEQSRAATPLTAKELKELNGLRFLVSQQGHKDKHGRLRVKRMTDKQWQRFVDLLQRSEATVGMAPDDLKRMADTCKTILDVGEAALGLSGVPAEVKVVLQYVPDDLKGD